MTRPRIPHGSMTVAKARQRWEAVRKAAQDGDPAKMLDAVQGFQSIAETMFLTWGNTCPKCGGTMRPGKAMGQTFTGLPDFDGDTSPVTLSPGGPGVLIDCVKCDACGHSEREDDE